MNREKVKQKQIIKKRERERKRRETDRQVVKEKKMSYGS
jgi:hypothetical protein